VASFDPSSRNRLTHHDLPRFPGDTLFDRVGRSVCAAGCLPRKELYEAWEVARRARRLFRGGRVVDVAGGHGLLAHLMLLLDGTSGGAWIVDPHPPASAAALRAALASAWPGLDTRVQTHTGPLETFTMEPADVLVSCHACGALTDRILDAATARRTPVAVLPCCHDEDTCDAGPFRGWMDLSLAIDTMRVRRLLDAGANVQTHTIPAAITPKNRLLLATWPAMSA
jgi:hypothetical protein